jgi:hypothetical protein
MAKKIASFIALVAADVGVIILCFWLAWVVRGKVISPMFPNWPKFTVAFPSFWPKLYMLGIWLAVFGYEKLYTKRRGFWEETRVLLRSTSIAFAFVLLVMSFTRTELIYSRWVIVLAWAFSLPLLPVVRSAVKYVLFRLDIWKKRVVTRSLDA